MKFKFYNKFNPFLEDQYIYILANIFIMKKEDLWENSQCGMFLEAMHGQQKVLTR